MLCLLLASPLILLGISALAALILGGRCEDRLEEYKAEQKVNVPTRLKSC